MPEKECLHRIVDPKSFENTFTMVNVQSQISMVDLFQDVALRCNTEEKKILWLAGCLEHGLITPERLAKAQQYLEALHEKDRLEQEEKAREQAEKQKQQDKPDSKFPRIFRQDELVCAEYVKSLGIETIIDLMNQIKGNPQRWQSLVAYRVPEAIRLLQDELNQRAIDKI
jgi:hypothetical protein